ncbi:FAD-dependent 5-carboxymethylaminomethyl-2-thiouridine(34) oxidoreductase MnmC [Alcaligenaceae bacterium]|nr:FAD-dependent 5-carboxymethylaminomethyl-2-thiouridine(34) oxidoreductase MnmC [Alcaligenaceae bacterium]
MSSNYEPLIPATLAFNEHGTPMNPDFGDVYHPGWGALEQARKVFLHGNGLPQRWQGKGSFTVCETGFGLGNNFVALWQAWRTDPQRSARLHVLSFEAHPFARQDMQRALADRLPQPEKALADQLVAAWPPSLPGLHRLEFEEGRLTLTLAFGTVARLAKQAGACVDAYFLDGFAPRVNPAMWTRSLFGQLVRMANAQATAATWCCTGDVRRGLRDAGFLVSKIAGFGGKREITVATLRPGLGRSPIRRVQAEPVLVVGGGLAGAGVAQALALRGHDVTVLDPVFAHGRGASHQGHIAAALMPVISRDDDIRARLSRAGVRRALQRWQGLSGAARPVRCGALELAPDAQHAQERRQALACLQLPTDWVKWLDVEQASEQAGRRLGSGGLWFSDGQMVQPQALLDVLLSHPRIHCMVGQVEQLQPDGSGLWLAMDSQGKEMARARHVVLAAAAQVVGLLAGIPQAPRLPKVESMYRMAGQVSYYDGNAASSQVILAGKGYCLPPVEGRYAGGSTYQPDALASQVTRQGHQQVGAKVASLLNIPLSGLGRLPGLADGWAGWRAAVTDRLPVIGPLDDVPGIWLACAYGSRGLSWAALAGDIIAASLNHEPLPLERELLRRISPR